MTKDQHQLEQEVTADIRALPTAEKRYLTCAETAKLVRKALKDAFPTQKFSVRSSTYSGGASIDVSWTDGPTAEAVDSAVEPYRGADFDGMEDLKTHRDSYLNGERVSFGADFIQTHRRLSEELRGSIEAAITEQTGKPYAPNADYEDDVIRWEGELLHARWGSDLVYRMSSVTSRIPS